MEESPYDAIIGDNDPSAIQSRYEQHRSRRNADQRQKLLDCGLRRLDIDQTLYKLLNTKKYPGFTDERHCLVFWARPTESVQLLITQVQNRLAEFAPKLWLLPRENLHLTAMEITHSLTAPEIASLTAKLQPSLENIMSLPCKNTVRLIKPLIGYDSSALALSFVPAAGQTIDYSTGDEYTYHHLRRDMWRECRRSGVEVASRYVLPSAHLTIARFVTHADHSLASDFVDEADGDGKLDATKMSSWLDRIDEINDWLKATYWPKDDGKVPEGGEWIVGDERGMDCMAGTIWYGRPSSGAVASGQPR